MAFLDKKFSELVECDKDYILNRAEREEPANELEFLSSVKKTLIEIISELENNADSRYKQKEEYLNAEIKSHFRLRGYTAENEAFHRGKIDITVSKYNFKWFIEAKIGRSDSTIFEGLLQLVTRYLTNQKNSAMLIYFKKEDAENDFNKWCDYINEKKWKKYSKNKGILLECENYFNKAEITRTPNTSIKSASLSCKLPSGINTNIDCYGVNLYFNPLDRSGRECKEYQKNNHIEKIIHYYYQHKENKEIDIDNLFESISGLFNIHEEFENLL